MKKAWWALVVAVVAAAGGFLWWKPQALAPEVKFMTLSGEALATRDFRGKVWLVNFWATSCSTCVKEMPMLSALHREFSGQGFEVVAVAMQYDPPNYVAAFARQHELPFRVALDARNEVAKGFGGVRMTPTTFLIDRRGRIVQEYLGAPDFAKVRALIDQLLQEPA